MKKPPGKNTKPPAVKSTKDMNNRDTNITGASGYAIPQPVQLKIYLDSAEFTDGFKLIETYWCILGKQNDGPDVYVNTVVSLYALTEWVKRAYSADEMYDFVNHEGEHVQKITKRDFDRFVIDDPRLFVKEYIERSEQVKEFVVFQAAENKRLREIAAAEYWMQHPDELNQHVAAKFECSNVGLRARIKTMLQPKRENI